MPASLQLDLFLSPLKSSCIYAHVLANSSRQGFGPESIPEAKSLDWSQDGLRSQDYYTCQFHSFAAIQKSAFSDAIGRSPHGSAFPIYDRLCACMPLSTTLKLPSSCKQLRQAYQQRWSVDSRLARFVKDPLRLRSELGKHASLISGSFVLQSFA